MKTNFKLSLRMHLFIIISCIIICAGLIVGVACQLFGDKYFNYGDDWSSYTSVTVSYENVDFSNESEVKAICDEAFKASGVNYFTAPQGDKDTGGIIVFRFSTSTDETKLNNAMVLIKAKIDEKAAAAGGITLSSVTANKVQGLLGGEKAVTMCAAAIASIIAFSFIYFAIRYKLSTAFGALLAYVHNIAIFVSLVALLRIPVGSSIFAFATLTVLMTAIGLCFLFDRVRKNFKNEETNKLPANEIIELSASESFKINVFLPVFIALFAVITFVFTAISAMSVITIISPVVCALISVIACIYGNTMFTPAVYTRFKAIGENFKSKRQRESKEKLGK